jgi:uncharacterized membrane protein YhaH (DUF805 family)
MSSVQKGEPVSFLEVCQDWFRLKGTVGRQKYCLVGFGLAFLKYGIEFSVIGIATRTFYSPVDFVNPWLSTKAPFLVNAPFFGIVWLLLTIPFVWIAIAMSARRAADAGVTPWWGLMVLIPLFNLLLMTVLTVLPSRLFKLSLAQEQALERKQRELAMAFRPSATIDDHRSLMHRPNSNRWLPAVAAGCLTQTMVGMVSVWVLQTYGFILFFSAPVIAGAVSGFVYSRNGRQSVLRLIVMILSMNLCSYVAMFLLGLDGAICLVMTLPLLGPLSVIGGLIGSAIRTSQLRPGRDERNGMIGMMIFLPLFIIVDRFDKQPELYAVTTSVDIAASREVVWQQVIAFPEIDAPLEWYFQLGIAAPMNAKIFGHGVGATRHCQFTTGAFVEPITTWEEPHRLAFDVISQPPAMHEMTLYPHLHPLHLDTGFTSRRGEFRLEGLPGGATRLHGTTWYELDVRPRMYWNCLAEPVLHSIHRRVLTHIATQAEKDPDDIDGSRPTFSNQNRAQ